MLVYAFHPKILKLLTHNKEISMMQLFRKISKKLKFSLPNYERWIDIGT